MRDDFYRFFFYFHIILHYSLISLVDHHPRKKLSDHPAFGSWKNKNVDSLDYQIALREEWKT